MRAFLGRILGLLSSLGTSCVLLLLLGVLTWLGTLAQVEAGLFAAQKAYFESWMVLQPVGDVAIPLPGGQLVMGLLFVNLIVGGLLRLRRNRSLVGVFVTHVGIALLLVSGFVTLHWSQDGHVTLFEGGRANAYTSAYRWEIAVQRDLGGGRVEEHLVPAEDFQDAEPARPVTLVSPELPFDLRIERVMTNCRKLPKGPMFDVDVPVVAGAYLQSQPVDPEAQANVAGAYVRLVDDDGVARDAALWGRDPAPFTAVIGGEHWSVSLRKERYPLPFTIALDDFTKVDHPRSGMPKAFSSDVTVIEGSTARQVTISMNEPLREQGLVIYQASWGPGNARPGDPLFSSLAVVRNPSDRWPLWACIVIACGLVLHFGGKLHRFVRAEGRRS